MYRKIIHEGYILGLAIGSIGIEITEQEYNELAEIFHVMPVAPEGCEYKLTESLDWEKVEKTDDVDDTEAFGIIFGGAE